MEARFEITKTDDDVFHWRLQSDGGGTAAKGDGYTSREDAIDGARSVQSAVAAAPVVDLAGEVDRLAYGQVTLIGNAPLPKVEPANSSIVEMPNARAAVLGRRVSAVVTAAVSAGGEVAVQAAVEIQATVETAALNVADAAATAAREISATVEEQAVLVAEATVAVAEARRDEAELVRRIVDDAIRTPRS